MLTPEAQQQLDELKAKALECQNKYSRLAAQQIKLYHKNKLPALLAAELTFAIVKSGAIADGIDEALAFFCACGALTSPQCGEAMKEIAASYNKETSE